MGELFMKARFTLCLSIVRRGSVSHPISCPSDCPSSVRACFEGCCATPADSRENMYYGATQGQCGVTARSSLSVEFYSLGTMKIESAACDLPPYGFITKEFSRSVRPFSASQRAPLRPSGFRAVFGAESLGTDSARVENMGELFMKARFTLCLSTVRRGSVSHPIPRRFHCPSSVRACFGCCHVHSCATFTDSQENMYYGVSKGKYGVALLLRYWVRAPSHPKTA